MTTDNASGPVRCCATVAPVGRYNRQCEHFAVVEVRERGRDWRPVCRVHDGQRRPAYRRPEVRVLAK